MIGKESKQFVQKAMKIYLNQLNVYQFKVTLSQRRKSY